MRVKGDAGSMFQGYVGVVLQNDTSIEKNAQGHQEPLHQKMCQSQKEIDPILLPKKHAGRVAFSTPMGLDVCNSSISFFKEPDDHPPHLS